MMIIIPRSATAFSPSSGLFPSRQPPTTTAPSRGSRDGRRTTRQPTGSILINNNSNNENHWRLAADNTNNVPAPASSQQEPPSPLWQELSKLLQRTSWFSWWAQTILTVISCTILLFAGNASQTSANKSVPSFFLSGLGLVTSLASIIWTWGNGARLSRRLLRNKQQNNNNNNNSKNGPKTGRFAFQPASPNDLLRRAIRVQCSINLIGLFFTLLAAEEIVGSLALKVLTNNNALFMAAPAAGAPGGGWVQPLDILIVQANTNTLLSHFLSLAASLYLADRTRWLTQQSSSLSNGDTTMQ